MNIILWFLTYYLKILQAFITQDTGYFKVFDLGQGYTFSCVNNFEKTQTISFAGTFSAPPKIILTIEKLDSSAGSLDSLFYAQSVTTTSFQLYLKCQTGQLWGTRLRWFAINDERVQVITQTTTTNYSNYTIPHSNPNAVAGFISVYSISYSGALNFYINISSLTPTNVTIQFNNPQNLLVNMARLYFQIILTSPEFVKVISTQNLTSNFNSASISVIANTFFMIATQGYIYAHTETLRLNLVQTSGVYVQSMITEIQLYYSFTEYLLLKCDHIRVSQTQNPFLSDYIPLTLTISEQNLIYTNVGTYTVILEKSLPTITFMTQLSCQIGKKILTKYYKYPDNTGQNQMQNLVHYYGGPNKEITYYPRFIQQVAGYEEIDLVLSTSGLTITQNLYNQEISTGTLMTFQIVNV